VTGVLAAEGTAAKVVLRGRGQDVRCPVDKKVHRVPRTDNEAEFWANVQRHCEEAFQKRFRVPWRPSPSLGRVSDSQEKRARAIRAQLRRAMADAVDFVKETMEQHDVTQ
jgi:hypothetical protein